MLKLICCCLFTGVTFTTLAPQAASSEWAPGDYNLDGTVTLEDHATWLDAYGSVYSPPSQAVHTISITAVGQGARGWLYVGNDSIILETRTRTGRSLDGEYTLEILDSGFGVLSVAGDDKAIEIDLGGTNSTATEIAIALESDSRFSRAELQGAGESIATPSYYYFEMVGSQIASTDTIYLTTVEKTSEFNQVGFEFIEDTTLASNTSVADYDDDRNVIEVKINGDQTFAQIARTIDDDLDHLFHAAAATGTGAVNGNSLAISPSLLQASEPLLTWPGVSADPAVMVGDGNFDGVVDGADFTIWRDAYLATDSVPEPSAGVLCLITLSLAGVRTRPSHS